MKNPRCWLTTLFVAFALLPICPASEDRKGGVKKDDKASIWMTKKLEFSQKILHGLTKGDCEMVRQNADEMIVVGYLESWDRASLPAYRKQLKAFENANKELVRQAERKNMNLATRAYTRLVISCIECHNVVRDAKAK